MKKYLRSKNAIKDGRKTQLARMRKSIYKFAKFKQDCAALWTHFAPAVIDALKTMARDIETLNASLPSVTWQEKE